VPDNKDPASAGWHLDRRVPIAIIFALIVQTGGIFYWGGQLATRVDNTEARVERLETEADVADQRQTTILERLARMEERSNQQLRVLERIEQRLGGRRPDRP